MGYVGSNNYENSNNIRKEAKESDNDMKLEYTAGAGDGKSKLEKCIEDASDECVINNSKTLQDSFLEFLDGVSTPAKATPKGIEETEIQGKATTTIVCHGLKEDPSRAKSRDSQSSYPYESPMELGKVIDVIGKMVETLNNHIEMLRDEKILNQMLRNTIEFQKDDFSSRAIRITVLETILERTSKPTQDNSNRNYTTQQHPKVSTQSTCNDLPARPLQESQQSKELPSFNSQLEDYVKRKREKYADCLVKCKSEALFSLKGP